MSYKPNFCSDCGEKIERDDWRLLTSRRFCDNCAAHLDAPQKRFLPFIIAAIVIFGGGMLVGRFLQEKPKAVALIQNQPVSSPQQTSSPQTARTNQSAAAQPATKAAVSAAPKMQPQTLIGVQPQTAPNAADETEISYFCGARTQKGTPCSRRVRGGGRCWQHAGKPAMLPEDKLKITP